MTARRLKLSTFLVLVAIAGLLLAGSVRSMECNNPDVRAWQGWVAILSERASVAKKAQAEARTTAGLLDYEIIAKKAEIIEERLARAKLSLAEVKSSCRNCRGCRIKAAISW